MNAKNKAFVLKLSYAAMCLALCLVLPFLTGQIPEIGSMLCPMHLPVLLAGYLCGPWWAAIVGSTAPLLRNLMFGMPPFPTAIAMCLELAAYGLAAGILYIRLQKKTYNIYISLFAAMLFGRIAYGIAMTVILGFSSSVYSWQAFIAGAFTGAIPGIILQILLIPILVIALKKAHIIKE